EIYKLSGIENSERHKNNYLKRLQIVRKLINTEVKEQSQRILNRDEQDKIIALYYILNSHNPLIISDILDIPYELVKKHIEKNIDRYSIQHCQQCGLQYLSKKIELEGEILNTPCPHCFTMKMPYPRATEPIALERYEFKIIDEKILKTALSYFIKLKQTINVYKKAKKKGTFSKNKAPVMQYLYEGLLWLFGQTNINFPHTFESVCISIGKDPNQTRDELLQFLFIAEVEIQSELIKQKIETLRVAENLIDFIEITSYYIYSGSEDQQIREYFKNKYIQCNIPMLYNFSI
ncbi:MAG: hypothetical protein ACPLXO_04460, partial [Desulfurella sp.]